MNKIFLILFFASTTLNLKAQNIPANLQNALLVHWNFDSDNSCGTSDRYFYLQPQGTVNLTQSQIKNKALYLDGKKSFVNVSEGIDFYNQFSIFAWVKPDSLITQADILNTKIENLQQQNQISLKKSDSLLKKAIFSTKFIDSLTKKNKWTFKKKIDSLKKDSIFAKMKFDSLQLFSNNLKIEINKLQQKINSLPKQQFSQYPILTQFRKTDKFFPPEYRIECGIRKDKNKIFAYFETEDRTEHFIVEEQIEKFVKQNQYFSICYSFDGCELSIFVNAKKITSKKIFLNLRTPQDRDSLFLGRNLEKTFFYNGEMDEISIFNQPLTQSDVQFLFEKHFPNPPQRNESPVYFPQEKTSNLVYENIIKNPTLNANLICYWDFDKNQLRGTTFGYPAKLWRKEQQDSNGIKQKGIKFNGTKDHIFVEKGLNLFNHFSIALWFEPQNISQKQILFQQSKENQRVIELGIEDSTVYFKFNEVFLKNVKAKISNQKWNFLVCTSNGCEIKLFLNNLEIATMPHKMNIREFQNADSLFFGIAKNKSLAFKGKIDEIMIYDKALKPLTINVLWNKNFPISFSNEKKVFLKNDTLLFFENSHRFENQTLDTTIYVSQTNFVMELWDNDIEDGDRIAIFNENDEIIEKNLQLTKKKKRIPFSINPDNRTFLFFNALNEGDIDGNTVSIRIVKEKKFLWFFTCRKKLGEYSLSASKGENIAVRMIYQPNYSKLQKRKTIIRDSVFFTSPNISLEIWDNEFQDDDIISIDLNGNFILKDYSTKKFEKKRLNLKLNPNERNFLTFYAISKGKIGDNTCAVKVFQDGKLLRTLSVRTKDSENTTIIFEKKK